MRGLLVLLILAASVSLVHSQAGSSEFSIQGAAEQAVRQADAQIRTQQAQSQSGHNNRQSQGEDEAAQEEAQAAASAQQPGGSESVGGGDAAENQPEPLNCQELGVKFSKIFDKVSEEKHVPVNVLMAARGLGITAAKGQNELKKEIDHLADEQRHTNHCLEEEYDRMRTSQQLVENLSSQMHISVEDFVKKCESHVSRERFYKKVKSSGQLPDAATEKLKVFLGVSGDPPWLSFKKMMHEHKDETKARLKKLKESAERHEQEVADIVQKEQGVRRSVLDLMNAISASQAKTDGGDRSSKDLEAMEKKLQKLVEQAEGSVGHWGDRVSRLQQKESYHYARAGATLIMNSHRLLGSEDQDFNRMTNWTQTQVRHLLRGNEKLKKEVQKPLNKARNDIAIFRRDRDRMADLMKKDQNALAEDFSHRAHEVAKDIDYLVRGHMRDLEAEVESRINKQLANTRHQMLMMAQKERGAQEIELGRMRNQIDELTQEAWDLRREAEVAVREQTNHEREFRRFRQDMEKDWERDNNQLKHREATLQDTLKSNDDHMSTESESLQQTIKLQNDEIRKEMSHVSDEVLENLQREASNRQQETEFRVDEINGEILKDKSELQEIVQERDQAVNSASAMVSGYQAKSNALKSRLYTLEQEIDADLKKIPSPQEKRIQEQNDMEKAENECKVIAKKVADNIAPHMAAEAAQGSLTIQSIKEMKNKMCHDKAAAKHKLELNENVTPKTF